MIAPDPFVSAEVDISGMAGFMLDVQRLFASELWALSTGDEFKAAMALWGRAWQQVPAGSLPNDERLLAAFSGAGAKWKKVRSVALRGFVECSDGRLYHKTLCEDVNAAWSKRLKFRERTANATAARSQRNVQRNVHPVDSDRGQGTVTETEINSCGGLTPARPAAAFHELGKRLADVTGWQCGVRNIEQIEKLIADGVSLEDRVIPIAKTVAAELKRQGRPPPDTWAYLAKPIADPDRVVAPASKEIETVFVPEGSPYWHALVDSGKKASYLRTMLKQADDGTSGIYWAQSKLPELRSSA